MRARLVVLVTLVALVTAGCFEATTSIDVSEDGSGIVSGTYTVDTSEVPLVGGSACDLFLSQFAPDPSLGLEIEVSGSDCGFGFETAFTPETIGTALSAASIDGATLSQTGDCDCWEFRAPIGRIITQFDPNQFGVDAFSAGDVALQFKVRLPGRQVEHNGDEIDRDGFVVWNIDIENPPGELHLRTESGEAITGSAAGTALILVIAAVALIALGAGTWFVLRRKPPRTTATGTPTPSGDWTGAATMPPLDAGAWQPTTPPTVDAPARPSEAEAAGASVWDPTRNAYISFDPTTRSWLVYDDEKGTWLPG